MSADTGAAAREAVVLVHGFVETTRDGRQRAGGTITLITGNPSVIVDTGAPEQRQQILDALSSRGVDPASIEYIVNTHGHLDHVGNNSLFPRATFILDLDLAKDGEYWTHDFARTTLDLTPPGSESSIVVMRTPGHTDHDLSVIVGTSRGLVAVVGDLFEYEGDWLNNAWRAWSRDALAQQASRDAILALVDYIIPGHGDIFAVPPFAR